MGKAWKESSPPQRDSYIGWINGRLFYAVSTSTSLASRSTFEETTALLWYGKLPDQAADGKL